jgi:hypothetical protein
MNQNASQDFDNIDDEPTVEFVMDLSALHKQKINNYQRPSAGHMDGKAENRTNSMEERTSLQSCTLREYSDAVSQRSALRIAFVLAFSTPKQIQATDAFLQKENSGSNQCVQPEILMSGRIGLLAKRTSRDSNGVFHLGLELLRIVFAKPGSQSISLQREHLKSHVASTDDTQVNSPSTITFAMRHRALRVAAILCPQDVLEEIVSNERMLTPSNSLEHLSLRQCTFGTFVAKEIEEIGLPLPHSELLQLSSMHFLSYARSLWRDHRDDAILEKSKGRFYLLLIELCVHNEQTDPQFLKQILNEMTRHNYSRSLLQALEEVLDYEGRVTQSSLFSVYDSIKQATLTVAYTVFSELESFVLNWQDSFSYHHSDVINTIERLHTIVLTLLKAEEGIAHYDKYIALLSPFVDEPVVKALLTTTKQFRERVERQKSVRAS